MKWLLTIFDGIKKTLARFSQPGSKYRSGGVTGPVRSTGGKNELALGFSA